MQYPIPPGAPTRLNQSSGGPISILNNGPANLYLYRNSACSVLGAYDAIIGSGGAYTSPGGELWGVSDGSGLTCVVLTGAGVVNTGTTTVSGVVSVGNTVQVAGTVATTTAPSGGGSGGGSIAGTASTPVTVSFTATVNSSTASAYGNQRKIDRCQNGVLWVVLPPNNGSGNFYTSYSTDNGVTWTGSASVGSGNGQGNYTPNCSFFIDLDDYAHLVFKDAGNGAVFYVRGTPNSARTAYTWSTPLRFSDATSYGNYPDLVAFRDPAGSGAWFVHIIWSYVQSSNVTAERTQIQISSSGVIGSPVTNNLGASNVTGNDCVPSIDFRHTGDGKTVASSQPDLYVAWSAGQTGTGYGIRFIKAAYSSGTWTWGTEREITNAYYVPPNQSQWLNCIFDGARVMVGGMLYSSIGQTVGLWERDAADTTTTARVSQNYSCQFGSMTYDSKGTIYLFGYAGGSNITCYTWTRGATDYGGIACGALSGYVPYVSARRGYAGSRLDYIYTTGTASPYTVKAGNIT